MPSLFLVLLALGIGLALIILFVAFDVARLIDRQHVIAFARFQNALQDKPVLVLDDRYARVHSRHPSLLAAFSKRADCPSSPV